MLGIIVLLLGSFTKAEVVTAADRTRVGAVVFSSDAEDVFTLGQYNTHADYDVIDPVPRPDRKVGTLTHLGLENAVARLQAEGREGVNQILVVITDGKSTAPGPILVQATRIHETTDIRVLAVGIGRDTDFAELDLIASGQDGDNVYIANSFDDLNLIKEAIAKGSCTVHQKDKERALCPLPCIADGFVVGLPKAGERVSVRCRPGYSVSGAAALTCGRDGKWLEAIPACVKNCPHVVGLSFGSANYLDDQRNGIGGRVQFSCAEGYRLKGPEVISCKTNSKWSKRPPTCKRARCKTYTRINKGRVVQDTMPGGTANFTCDMNYALIGDSTLTCKKNSKWDNRKPTCKKERICKIPRFFSRGVASHYNQLSVGEAITYTCHHGYQMVGKDQIKCERDGKLNGKPPKCKNQRCPWLPFIANGNIKRFGDPVTKMTFSCEEGFTLKGDWKLTCSNRKWSNKYPKCIDEKGCRAIRFIRHGYIRNEYSRRVGSVLRIECDDGYQLPKGVSGKIVCQEDRKWSDDIPTCTRNPDITHAVNRCPKIIDLVNGKCTGSNALSSTVHCSCKPGYRIQGQRRMRCRQSGRWTAPFKSSQFPKCKYVRCKQLRPISNGETTIREVRTGAVLRYSCKPGFSLIGSKILRCRDNKWSSEVLPKCKETRCVNLLSIRNGQVSDVSTGDTRGSVRSIVCDTGYQLIGKSQVTCAQGRWSPAMPRCVAVKRCLPIDGIKFGSVEGTEVTVGSRLKVTCEPGYTRKGPRQLKCLPSQRWSADVKCSLITCPSIPYLDNGSVSGYSTVPGVTVSYDCQPGFVRRGKGKVVCRRDGKWTSAPPTCEPKVTCPSLCIDNGAAIYDGVKPGTLARMRCNDGYMLSGDGLMQCSDEGRWTKDMPTCVSSIPEECISREMDLYFIVGLSESENIDEMENLIKKLASHLSIGRSTIRIGVISFDKTARVEVNTNDYKDIGSFTIANILSREIRAKGNYLHKALDLLLDSKKLRSERETRVLIITQNDIQKQTRVEKAADQLKAKGVSILVLCVGGEPKQETLKSLGTSDERTTVFKLNTFNEIFDDTFSSMKITEAICKTNSTSEECEGVQLDVYFVVDTSKSISDADMARADITIRIFIANFDIGPSKTRFGLITFNRFVYEDIFLDDYESREDFIGITKLLNRTAPGELQGGTRTDLGLEKMLENFKKESRDGATRQVCILITDGKSTADVQKVAAKMDKTDIKRIAIGVGRGADEAELKLLASGEDAENVVLSRDFEHLRSVVSSILASACT